MKHRGPSRKGKIAVFSRYTLEPHEQRELKALTKREKRSVANMISVLLSEALQARRQTRAESE